MAERPDIRLTAAWIAAAAGGTLVAGDPAREAGGVSIDTRTLEPGELYVAIRGDRFDGADFADAAVAAGAIGVVMPKGRGVRPAGAFVIDVSDTTEALQALGRAVREASGTKVVAITGSAGKTTTKEVTAELLAERYRVIRNRGNFNNHIGLPLSLVELRTRPDMAVVELGMNHAGEISTLVRIAEPDVRVWTNVGDAHLGLFSSVDTIADAKAEIFEGATPSTVLVANADDPRIMARAPRFKGRVVTFGIERTADVRATEIDARGVSGVRARVSTARGEVTIESPLVGVANLANVLAATAVALEFDVPLGAVAARVARLAPAPHRGEIVRLAKGVTLIDDCYNASPAATKRSLDVLALEGSRGRRVAMLGEMLELGAHAVGLHEEVGRAAAASADLLVAVGGEPAAALASAAMAAGMRPDRVRYFPASDTAAEAVPVLVNAGDTVLVKGSRGIRMERVVERLTQEFA